MKGPVIHAGRLRSGHYCLTVRAAGRGDRVEAIKRCCINAPAVYYKRPISVVQPRHGRISV